MIGLLRRETGVPPVLRKRMDSAERVLAVGDTATTVVAATQLGLWLPVSGPGSEADAAADGSAPEGSAPDGSAPEGSAPDGSAPAGPAWRRVGWDRVVLATWTDGGLHVVEGDRDEHGVITDLPAVNQVLTVPRNLPAIVRQRVESSIARWEQLRVPGGTARLIARRVPGRDGLLWTGRLDTGTPDSPIARAVLIGQLDQVAAAAARANLT